MTDDTTPAAALDGNRQQFEQTLDKALKSRGNLLVLARCAEALQMNVIEENARSLVSEGAVVTDIERGRALWDLLRETIERLRPVATAPDDSPAWNLYAIAEGIYVQGKSTGEVAAELGISPRTFHRQRRVAVEAVATVMWQIEER